MLVRAKHVLKLPILACVLTVSGSGANPETSGFASCWQQLHAETAPITPACLRLVYAQPIDHWPAPHVDAGASWQELAALPPTPPEPADNPATPEKIALGERLFHDPRLSRSGQIACASCHERDLGWADGRKVAFGHDRQRGRRNAPSVAMSAWTQPLFWDGRAASLEEQALMPIEDPLEMAFTLPELEQRLNHDPDYPELFASVFAERRISADNLARALAAYQRSLSPRNDRFDRFLDGQRHLLNDQQLLGLHLFRTRARCMNCHSGPALSDNRFHNLGLHFYGRARQDLGRYEVTGNPADIGAFRTPTLRGVGRTGPYMHNGLLPQLRGIVNMYNNGMPRPKPTPAQLDDPLFPQPDPLLKPLALTAQEIDAVSAFLDML